MKPLSTELLYYFHNLLTFIMIGVWIVFSFIGYKLKNQKTITKISYGLIGFSILQEIMDYTNRIFLDELYVISLSTDLPLQFCSIGYYFSIIGIIMSVSEKKYNIKFEQFIFDCAYVLGFGGALQAMITVDLTGINNMIGSFALNWQHSIIILNVLWLIFAYNKRFNLRGVLNAFIFMNLAIIPVGIINYFLSANYMFVCSPPNVNNPLLIGDWPIYLIILEFVYFLYILILYLPFKLLHKK
ncbi:MAG: TIGR02206 family membrane protein [Candidatus Marinimicrobia bacterium]|nr:TIGR02206 family membrane protein [Candidatus Neomarinimicrobiota bacterium]